MFDRRTGVSLLKGRVMSKGDYAPSTCNLLRFGCGQVPHLQATRSWHSHTAACDLYFLWAQLCAPCPGTRSPARAEPTKKRDGEPKPAARSPPWQIDALPPCRGTRGCAQHGPAGSSSVLAHRAPGSSVGGAWPQPPGPCTVPAQRCCLGGRRGTRNQTAWMDLIWPTAHCATCDSVCDSELGNTAKNRAELTHPSASYFFPVPQRNSFSHMWMLLVYRIAASWLLCSPKCPPSPRWLQTGDGEKGTEQHTLWAEASQEKKKNPHFLRFCDLSVTLTKMVSYCCT